MAEQQSELFEEFESSTKRRRKLRNKYFLQRNLTVTLTHENIVFLIIGFILTVALAYSLGVERGRGLVGDSREIAAPLVVKEVKKSPLPEESATASGQPKTQETLKPFTIQVIAYRSKKRAEQEMADLTREGFKCFVIFEKGWYQVSVGSFSSKEEATEILSKLKERYRDCFLRRR